MHRTLIAIAKILKGETVYDSGDLSSDTRNMLRTLALNGEIIQSQEGQSVWWSIRPSAVEHIIRECASRI